MVGPNTTVPSRPGDPQRLALEPGTVSDWNALHRAIDVKERLLRKGTFKWLASLPAHVRPMATARQRSTAAENAMSRRLMFKSRLYLAGKLAPFPIRRIVGTPSQTQTVTVLQALGPATLAA
jgi:hypothetical protein